MSGFVLHPEGLADLDEIWEFISADNLDAADRVVDEIHLAMQSLANFPRIGHSRGDLTSQPLRFHPVRDYLIAYAPDESLSSCSPCSMAAAILASSLLFCAKENKYP